MKGTRRADMMKRLPARSAAWWAWFAAQLWFWARIMAAGAFVAGAGFWFWSDGWAEKVSAGAQRIFATQAAHIGFAVREVQIEGRNYIDRDTLKDVIGIAPGDPIFAIDMPALHARLMEIPWVKSAEIVRTLPDMLLIKLEERMPVAIWVDSPKGASLIDAEGVLLTQDNLASYGRLLAVMGTGAETQAYTLIMMLKGQPDIAVRVKTAKRISERRWDLVLEDGKIIRLPDTDEGLALARLAKAQSEGQLMDQDLTAIDMRQPDRIILETRPGEVRDLLLKTGDPV